MIKHFLRAAATLLCALGLLPATALAKDGKTAENSLLWRVTGPGLSKPSYLFGTIHAICEADYFWTPVMKRSFDSSATLCLEMDLDDPTMIMQVGMGMLNTDGKSLEDYFTPAEYQRLEAYVQDSLGMPMMMLKMMKPAVLMMLFSSKGGLPCDNPVAYETKLMEAAKANDKEVDGLEPVKEQIAALESLPSDSIAREVMKVVDGEKTDSELFTRLVTAYKAQDLAALEKLMSTGEGLSGGERGALLDDRNVRWIPRMEERMKRESVFFAVGAGHLPGQKGVIALLRKAGYQVVPVR